MWCSWIGNAGGCSRAESAVDVEHGSGDVGGVRAREERDAGGHLLGTRVTTQRGGRGSGRGELAVGRVHLGVDQSGLQDVDSDPARPEVTRRAAYAFGLELLDDLLSAVGGGVVADRDVGAVGGESPRGRRTDAS